MALRDSWRKALALSGLVDDSQPTNHDYLLRLPPEPLEGHDPHALGAAPTEYPAPATAPGHEPWPATEPETWSPTEAEYVEEAPADYGYDEAGHIVVRRIGAALDPPPPPGHDEIVEVFGGVPAAAPPPAPPPSPATAAAGIAPSPPPTPPPTPTPATGDVGVHRISPRSFNDAQYVADRYKSATPVVLDLQGVETDLAKRLIGFASGLTYGLEGGMERLDDRVFLLVPRGVEVSPGQRARLAAQGSLNRA